MLALPELKTAHVAQTPLTYRQKSGGNDFFHHFLQAPAARLEHATLCSASKCSNPLSYAGVCSFLKSERHFTTFPQLSKWELTFLLIRNHPPVDVAGVIVVDGDQV